MQAWCLLGQNQMFDTLVETIHANGGYLARVVTNVPDHTKPPAPSFATRLARYRRWLAAHHPGLECREIALDEFEPDSAHHHFPGFYGPRLPGYLRQLEARHPGLTHANLIHPSATVSPFAQLGAGCFISVGSVIGPWATIGDFAHICYSLVAHDCFLHPHAYLLPHCTLASSITVHSHALVCLRSAVIPGLTLGRGCVVAPGSVVRKDIPARVLAAGNPARILKSLPPLPA